MALVLSSALPGTAARFLPDEFRLPAPAFRTASCPCSDKNLCTPVDKHYDLETFGFGADNFQAGFDWGSITTVAWGSGSDLVCEAHTHGVRVIAGVSPPLTDDQDKIAEFVSATVASVQENFYDGVTFDWESPVDGFDDSNNAYYLDVIQQTTKALKAINPNYQVSVCAAWSPNGIDGRYYDYQALAAATDYLYVMCYDTRSQIFDQCVASANAPANLCKNGIEAYRQIGVPDEKLILGIPWYGYRYECVDPAFDPAVDKTCEIAQVPFRGVNCSDAAGTEVAYSGIRSIINSGLNSSAVMRDSYMNVPFFNYVDPDTSKVYQVWYDDPESLSTIYKWVIDKGLGGTGPYRWDQLDLAGNPDESQEMWDAIKVVREAN
mmetsp:Transcript_10508/g.21258  ORF Transcript_10508/g.21258 Transcript_10508/m.21258 type:complete len:378 (-) Transcript_10508:31-1164(-)